ncbi:hypothetical protein C8R46DRAFT_1042150 [Mycena filopes]|nr:hypothetical protein C8R46DRAFT_1042150 [Mycena filopes]
MKWYLFRVRPACEVYCPQTRVTSSCDLQFFQVLVLYISGDVISGAFSCTKVLGHSTRGRDGGIAGWHPVRQQSVGINVLEVIVGIPNFNGDAGWRQDCDWEQKQGQVLGNMRGRPFFNGPGWARSTNVWRKTQSESTPFLANAAFAISEVYCRGVLSLGAEFSLYAANAARFRIVYIYLELRTQVDDCVTHQYWGLTRMYRLISLTPHILEGLAEKSAETTGRRRARIHRSNDMLEYTPDMTGEKFKIQHLGALVAGVHSRGKFWSTDLLEWNRGPGHLKRAFKIRQKFTNLVFLPFAWMEVRNAHTVLDPTLAWLSRRVSSELLDGVFYRVACDAGVPICRTRCDAGEFLDANEFPSPDRQTQANKVDISHSGEFHQKRTGGQISQRELYIRERESKLSFGVQRGFYDPSGVHLDTTLPRPNLARNQTRISMNIDESAGASGRRACLGHWAQQTTWHRSVVSSPEAPQVMELDMPARTAYGPRRVLQGLAGGSASMSTATAANPPRLVYETHFHRIVGAASAAVQDFVYPNRLQSPLVPDFLAAKPTLPPRCSSNATTHGPFSTVRIEIAVALPSAKRFVSPLA